MFALISLILISHQQQCIVLASRHTQALIFLSDINAYLRSFYSTLRPHEHALAVSENVYQRIQGLFIAFIGDGTLGLVCVA